MATALAQPRLSWLNRIIIPRKMAIFMLHRFATHDGSLAGHDPDFMRQCLQKLRALGFNFVSLKDILCDLSGGERVPPRSVAFTIDDGYWDHAEIAAPIFIEQNCPVTIFLITGFIDGKLWPWDQRLAWLYANASVADAEIEIANAKTMVHTAPPYRDSLKRTQNFMKRLDGQSIEQLLESLSRKLQAPIPKEPPKQHRPLTWDQARLLESQGVDFAPHSVSHYSLSRLRDDLVLAEISESWQRIKEELKHPTPAFAWPTGRSFDYSSATLEQLKSANLDLALTAQSGYADLAWEINGPQILHRFSMPRTLIDLYQCVTAIDQIASNTKRLF